MDIRTHTLPSFVECVIDGRKHHAFVIGTKGEHKFLVYLLKQRIGSEVEAKACTPIELENLDGGLTGFAVVHPCYGLCQIEHEGNGASELHVILRTPEGALTDWIPIDEIIFSCPCCNGLIHS